MSAINGKDVRLKLIESGSTAGLAIAGCDRSVNIQLNTEMVEVTGPAAYFAEFMPTYDSATINLDSLLVINPDGTELASDVIIQWKQDHQLLDFQIIWQEGVDAREIIGQCYITAAGVTGAIDAVAEMSVELIVTGRYDCYTV